MEVNQSQVFIRVVVMIICVGYLFCYLDLGRSGNLSHLSLTDGDLVAETNNWKRKKIVTEKK